MRKITKKAIDKFLSKTPFNNGNMMVEKVNENIYLNMPKKAEVALRLYNNAIAYLTTDNNLYISTCGYNTQTTKERLNGLPNVQVNTIKGKLFLNGKEWNGDMIKIGKI